MVIIAFTWTYIVGVYIDENMIPIWIRNDDRKAKILLKYGLTFIASIHLKPNSQSDINIFNFFMYLEVTCKILLCLANSMIFNKPLAIKAFQ